MREVVKGDEGLSRARNTRRLAGIDPARISFRTPTGIRYRAWVRLYHSGHPLVSDTELGCACKCSEKQVELTSEFTKRIF